MDNCPHKHLNSTLQRSLSNSKGQRPTLGGKLGSDVQQDAEVGGAVCLCRPHPVKLKFLSLPPRCNQEFDAEMA